MTEHRIRHPARAAIAGGYVLPPRPRGINPCGRAHRSIYCTTSREVQRDLERLRRSLRAKAPADGVIFSRDGYRCVVCGRAEELVADHQVPLCRGGPSTRENLITLCWPCNNSKGAKTLDEFLAYREASQ